MTRWLSGWRACIRIARRDALKHPGRSLLVVAMIALPVIGVAASDVVFRSHQLTAAERADRDMGTVADALVRDYGSAPVAQAPDGSQFQFTSDKGTHTKTDPLTLLRSALPTGSRVLPVRKALLMLQNAGDPLAPTASTDVTIADLSDPAVAGEYPTVSGRAAVKPDEVELTQPLARQLGVELGDRVVTFRPAHTLRVVGIIKLRWRPGDGLAFAPLNGLLDPASSSSVVNSSGGDEYLIKSPRPIHWSDVLQLNAFGLVVLSRDAYLHPPSDTVVPFTRDFPGTGRYSAVTALVVVSGMALLEIVLLAGPAFAVGARRQRRELAVIAAVGAERVDLRRTVLAQGVVLGGCGGLAGVGLGIALGLAARTVLRDHADEVFGGLHLHVLELIGAALVGIVTGVLAAVWPARAAGRQDIVAALAGRRGTTRSSRLLPVVGLVAFVVGIGVAAVGAVQARRATFILGGSMLAELGLVMCTPILVGFGGTLSPLFRGSVRLALRDAARNRVRSAPAAAAILAAAAGCVGVLVYSTSIAAHNRDTYVAAAPPGTVIVQLPWGDTGATETTPATADLIATTLRSSLPVRDVAVVDTGGGACTPDAGPCVNVSVRQPPTCDKGRACVTGAVSYLPEPIVGGPALVPLLTGHDDQQAEQMLRDGGVVVFDPAEVVDGKATLRISTVQVPSNGENRQSTHVEPPVEVALPAAAVQPRGNAAPPFVLSPQAASKLGLSVEPAAVIASTTTMPSGHAEDLARTAVQRAGAAALIVERGYHDRSAALRLALIGFAALVIVGASGIATGLAIADGRADHGTLAAVGASPGVRRRLAAAQSAVLGLLGAIAGAMAGVIPAAAVLHSHSIGREPGYPLVLPWPSLLAMVFGVPLLGAAFAWLFTRSRLPLGRRAT